MAYDPEGGQESRQYNDMLQGFHQCPEEAAGFVGSPSEVGIVETAIIRQTMSCSHELLSVLKAPN